MKIPSRSNPAFFCLLVLATSSLTVAQEAGTVRRVSTGNIAFCWCPPGQYEAGSPDDEQGRDPDETQGSITLTQGFWFSQIEVTEAQWKSVETADIEEAIAAMMASAKDDQRPKSGVSWNEALDYCGRLTKYLRAVEELLAERGRLQASRILKSDEELRLPTEAEWEYACRAGTVTQFP